MSNCNLQVLNRLCNTEIDLVENWFRANKLTTNSKKASKFILSKYSTFGENSNQSSDFHIKMGNINL